MALLFARLANNFIKNGYYPTDEVTLGRILGALTCRGAAARIIDPCCGEGAALAELKHHLQESGRAVEAFGVEFDRERAWHAKTVLDRAIHSDVHDVVVSPRSMGLLFLNPPYGRGVADTAGTGDSETAERIERTFLRKTVPLLVHDGVLVLVVPHYVMDTEMATYLARNFRELRVFMAPETAFRQCVVFGIKDRARHPPRVVLSMFERLRAGEGVDVLPEDWLDAPYEVPQAFVDPELRFHAVRLDPAQLRGELQRFRRSTLWEGFETHFNQTALNHRRPLREMSPWHLALALAAGQVSGVVTSPAGRVLLVKGDTHKQKQRSTVIETGPKGEVSETVILTDRFVPVINAIEFTPGRLGRIVTIR